jgi:hypothetical protein
MAEAYLAAVQPPLPTDTFITTSSRIHKRDLDALGPASSLKKTSRYVVL